MVEQINPDLTNEQKKVLFESNTEPPFSGKFYLAEEKGAYICANCSNPLFKSDAKFDSGCGWPSFFEPYNDKSVSLNEDNSLGMSRTEVTCKKCGAHLGHVFDDAPKTPTVKRYCINSLSLDLKK